MITTEAMVADHVEKPADGDASSNDARGGGY
jgi:hypothetical protein